MQRMRRLERGSPTSPSAGRFVQYDGLSTSWPGSGRVPAARCRAVRAFWTRVSNLLGLPQLPPCGGTRELSDSRCRPPVRRLVTTSRHRWRSSRLGVSTWTTRAPRQPLTGLARAAAGIGLFLTTQRAGAGPAPTGPAPLPLSSSGINAHNAGSAEQQASRTVHGSAVRVDGEVEGPS